MIALARLAYIIAVQRIVSNWRLEVVLFTGMLLAVALLSSGVIFSNLLAETALRHALHQAPLDESNFWVRVFTSQDTSPIASGRVSRFRSDNRFAEERVESPLISYLRDRALLMETSTFFFAGHSQLELANDVRPRGKFKHMTGLLPDRIEIVKGRWPYGGPGGVPAGNDSPLEVAVDSLGAQLLGLKVGDRMEAFPAAAFTEPPAIPVEIVGVFRRVDLDDEFWFGAKRTFSFKNDQWTLIHLFTTEAAILTRIYELYPTLYTDVTWFYFPDREAIRARDVDEILNRVRSIKTDVRANLRNSSSRIRLDRVLEDYQERLTLARIPLFLILFLVIGVLAYYLALIAGLVVKARTVEIAMLKSRGSTTMQIGLLALVEVIMLAVPAVVFGPLLALGVVWGLGRFFFGLGGGGDLATVSVTLSSGTFLIGLAGGLLGVIVFTAATLMAARQGIVEFLQMGARPARAPFVHRYYLDILLLGLVGLLWWQIQSRGSFLVRPLGTQGLEIDWSLLVGPVLLLLAVGLIVMRFFPIVLGLLARISEPVGPSWLVHGLRHVSRDPVVPGSLVLLLMFATALGVIGSTFSSTLERSQRERALYAAGADLRIEYGGTSDPSPLQGLSDLVVDQDLVLGAVEVHRTPGHLTTTGFSTSGTLLAVESENFDEVAWYRHDFSRPRCCSQFIRILPEFLANRVASLSLKDLTELLAAGSPTGEEGLLLPSDATALALTVQASRPHSRLILLARMQDSRGFYFDMKLGDMGKRGWQRLEAEIVPDRSAGRMTQDGWLMPTIRPPHRLLSIQLSTRFALSEPGALFFGELSAIGPDGPVVLEDFQNLDGWQAIQDFARPGLYGLEISESVGANGSGKSVRFSWAPGSIGLRGIRPGPPEEPIPAVVSRRFLELDDAEVGDVRIVGMTTFSLPVKISGVVDYFPTLDPFKKPFAVVDLKTFNHHANLHSPRPYGGSNELWVQLADGGANATNVTDLLGQEGIRVRKSFLASEMVKEQVEQPLVNAGWGAILVLMFLTLVLASASGVMLFSFIDTGERRTEFAVLRTLGSSRRQLNGAVWFSLFLVAVCGIGLGTVAGQLIGTSLLPLIEVAEQGAKVTPRMVFQINWTSLAVSYIILLAATGATVLWLIWFTAKMEVQQLLRIGEG
ncbi:MAG: ABC transporter permease [Chloroflexi bacterium]|nr:ABC transporter permease [Chloroflexota bacterium]